MTAVEWLIDRIAEKSVMEKDRYYIPYNSGTIDITHILEQAKEMEKQKEISDEEIEKEANNPVNDGYSFIEGAKWYREQLKSKI